MPFHMDCTVRTVSGWVMFNSVMSVERAISGFHCVMTKACPGCDRHHEHRHYKGTGEDHAHRFYLWNDLDRNNGI